MRYHNKSLGDKIKDVALATVTTAVIAGTCAGALWHYNNTESIKQEDFQNANWLPYHNENGRVYSCYTFENIPHHQDNYHLYLDEVNKRNKGKLEGDILLPDLDDNGKVGK